MAIHDGNTGWMRTIAVNATVNPASIAGLAAGNIDVTVPGAKVGDLAFATPSAVIVATTIDTVTSFYCYVVSANTVRIRFTNHHAATASDITSQVWRVGVVQTVA